ncbi:geranylgeranylglycerol-phosphate geranylgeranyltransferase [Bacteroidota bacterium]
MRHFLQLIRVNNLIIIAATMYFMHSFIVGPILSVNKLESQLENIDLILLIIATLIICASGYIINDYFDTKADNINHPQSVVVGRFVKRRTAMVLHFSLNIIGTFMGFLVSIRTGMFGYGFVFLFITILLWSYSTNLKRKFFLGNILVSTLTAFIPLIIIFYEVPLLRSFYQNTFPPINEISTLLIYWVGAFSFFAFFSAFIRELIKDIKNAEGDKECRYRTVPNVIGVKPTIYLIIIIIGILIAALIVVYILFLNELISLIYILVLIVIPLLYVVIKLPKAKNKKDFHFFSDLIKAVMFAGIVYSVVVKYILDNLFY